MTPIQPTRNLILIRLGDLNDTNIIVLPQTVEPTKPYGEVLATGPEVEEISVGDKICFNLAGLLPYEKGSDGIFCFIAEGNVLGKYTICHESL